MIEVIKLGFLREIKCPHCASILRFNIKEDVKLRDGTQYNATLHDYINQGVLFIDCPICNQKIEVSNKVYNDKIEV